MDEENKKLFAGQNEQYEKESRKSGKSRKPEKPGRTGNPGKSSEPVRARCSNESGAPGEAGEPGEAGKIGENAEKIEEEREEIKETGVVEKIGEASKAETEGEEEISSLPGRRSSLFLKLTALCVIIIFTALVLGGFLEIFTLPSLDFLVESQRLSRDPLVQELKQAVVRVTAIPKGQADPFSRQQRGTGFNISPKGLIVTNRHLVEEAGSLIVSFSGREDCRVAGWWIDPDVDLALITLEEGDFPFLDLEKEMLPQMGEQVMIIGNPLSYPRVVIQGKITGYRELNLDHFPQPVLEIDASIYGGSSGSPVFNKEGKVVAIIYASLKGQGEECARGLALPVALLDDYRDYVISTEKEKEKL